MLDALRAALAECEAADARGPTAGCLADLALLEATRGRLATAEALVDSYQALYAEGWLPETDGSGAAARLNPTAVAVPAPPRPHALHRGTRAAMFISVNTVRTHIRSVLQKLSANRRTDAVRSARQLEIIEADC